MEPATKEKDHKHECRQKIYLTENIKLETPP